MVFCFWSKINYLINYSIIIEKFDIISKYAPKVALKSFIRSNFLTIQLTSLIVKHSSFNKVSYIINLYKVFTQCMIHIYSKNTIMTNP